MRDLTPLTELSASGGWSAGVTELQRACSSRSDSLSDGESPLPPSTEG